MKYNIIFSLAVHESEFSVLSLLNNIFKFNQNVAVILHCADGFNLDFSNTTFGGNVFINPKKYKTGYVDQSLTIIHLSNLYHAESIGITSSFFSIVGSNEMFIKPGLYEYISKNYPLVVSKPLSSDYHVNHAYNDRDFMAVINHFKSDLIKSSPEGCFFSFEELISSFGSKYLKGYFNKLEKYYLSRGWSIVRRISNFIGRFFCAKLKISPKYLPSFISKFSYASEEIIFLSVLNYKYGIDNKYCHMDFSNNLFVSKEKVDTLIKESRYLSVKRINRIEGDVVRNYIDNL